MSEENKVCFSCAEEIKSAALVCKHCGQKQSEEDRRKFEGKAEKTKNSASKNRLKSVFLAVLIILGLGAGGAALTARYLESAQKDAAYNDSMKAFCGEILYGSWKNVALEDVGEAALGYIAGKYSSPAEMFVAANVSAYQDNADESRSLTRITPPSDEDLKVKARNLNSAASDLSLGWGRLASDYVPSYLGTLINSSTSAAESDSAYTLVRDELQKVKDAIQLATIECESFVSK